MDVVVVFILCQKPILGEYDLVTVVVKTRLCLTKPQCGNGQSRCHQKGFITGGVFVCFCFLFVSARLVDKKATVELPTDRQLVRADWRLINDLDLGRIVLIPRTKRRRREQRKKERKEGDNSLLPSLPIAQDVQPTQPLLPQRGGGWRLTGGGWWRGQNDNKTGIHLFIEAKKEGVGTPFGLAGGGSWERL